MESLVPADHSAEQTPPHNSASRGRTSAALSTKHRLETRFNSFTHEELCEFYLKTLQAYSSVSALCSGVSTLLCKLAQLYIVKAYTAMFTALVNHLASAKEKGMIVYTERILVAVISESILALVQFRRLDIIKCLSQSAGRSIPGALRKFSDPSFFDLILLVATNNGDKDLIHFLFNDDDPYLHIGLVTTLHVEILMGFAVLIETTHDGLEVFEWFYSGSFSNNISIDTLRADSNALVRAASLNGSLQLIAWATDRKLLDFADESIYFFGGDHSIALALDKGHIEVARFLLRRVRCGIPTRVLKILRKSINQMDHDARQFLLGTGLDRARFEALGVSGSEIVAQDYRIQGKCKR